MNALRFSVSEVRVATRPVHFRLSFHFGNIVVPQTDEAHVRIAIHMGDRRVEGKAAQLMVPRWFNKRARLSNDDTVTDLKASC